MNEDNLSNQLYVLKAFAIFSVITAHFSFGEINNFWDMYLIERFMRCGVAIFFILAGYFFYKTDVSTFCKKKLVRLIIPWIVFGSLMFCVGLITSRYPMTLKSYVDFMVGHASYLYFCTILVLCYIVSWLIPNKGKRRTIVCTAVVIITQLSIWSTAFGYLPQDIDPNKNFYSYLSPYLNIFNWIGFFTLGMILKDYDLISFICSLNNKRKSFICAFVILFILLGQYDINYGYWGIFSFVNELFYFWILLIVSTWISKRYLLNGLTLIGKNTYTIYLTHFFVLNKILTISISQRESIIFAIIRAPLCAIVLLVLFTIGEYISRTLGIGKIFTVITGINIISRPTNSDKTL